MHRSRWATQTRGQIQYLSFRCTKPIISRRPGLFKAEEQMEQKQGQNPFLNRKTSRPTAAKFRVGLPRIGRIIQDKKTLHICRSNPMFNHQNLVLSPSKSLNLCVNQTTNPSVTLGHHVGGEFFAGELRNYRGPERQVYLLCPAAPTA